MHSFHNTPYPKGRQLKSRSLFDAHSVASQRDETDLVRADQIARDALTELGWREEDLRRESRSRSTRGHPHEVPLARRLADDATVDRGSPSDREHQPSRSGPPHQHPAHAGGKVVNLRIPRGRLGASSCQGALWRTDRRSRLCPPRPGRFRAADRRPRRWIFVETHDVRFS